MNISREDTKTERVLALTGNVGPGQVGQLRAELLAALEDGQSDVLIDARQVDSFDDQAFAAFVTGRSRAKFRRRRLVVIDDEAGVVARSLRRTGLVFRFPVYADPVAAAEGLLADAAARRLLSFDESGTGSTGRTF